MEILQLLNDRLLHQLYDWLNVEDILQLHWYNSIKFQQFDFSVPQNKLQ
jgi:hypothetical protein